MNKVEMLEIFTEELRLIDGGTSVFDNNYRFEFDCHEKVFPHFKFLEEINDFPTICFYVVEETIAHIGADVRYKTAVIDVRGYVHEALGEEESSNYWAEALLDDIEHVLQHIRRKHPCFIDVRIVNLSTDEGIMEPYGVANMLLTVTYEAV